MTQSVRRCILPMNPCIPIHPLLSSSTKIHPHLLFGDLASISCAEHKREAIRNDVWKIVHSFLIPRPASR